MKIKKLVKLAPMMLLTFLLGLSGCSGSTSADARVNDHPNEADEELHVLTIGTADSGGTMYPVGSAIASVLSGHDEQLKVNLSASNGSYTNVENIKNGQFDMGLVSQTPCRLLEYTDEELQKILAASPFYVRATVPAGTYPGQTETLKTFGIKCLLCVDASMDEQLVYTITKILDESREELISAHPSLSNLSDPEYICSQLPIPLHPGAEKYYTEQGLLKTE